MLPIFKNLDHKCFSERFCQFSNYNQVFSPFWEVIIGAKWGHKGHKRSEHSLYFNQGFFVFDVINYLMFIPSNSVKGKVIFVLEKVHLKYLLHSSFTCFFTMNALIYHVLSSGWYFSHPTNEGPKKNQNI